MRSLLAILILIPFSSSAFAMSAYGEDNCVAKMMNGSTLEIGLVNDKPANPHKIIDRSDGTSKIRFVQFKGAPLGSHEDGSSLVLQKKSESNIVSRKTSDGCYEGYDITSTRSAVIESVSNELAGAYDLVEGKTIQFVCFTSFGAPTGKNCD